MSKKLFVEEKIVRAIKRIVPEPDLDYPEKDYGKKKNGWFWTMTVCPKGHIVELRKSYAKSSASKRQWETLRCNCKLRSSK